MSTYCQKSLVGHIIPVVWKYFSVGIDTVSHALSHISFRLPLKGHTSISNFCVIKSRWRICDT